MDDQGELFTIRRYHAAFTDSPYVLVRAEAQHCGHATLVSFPKPHGGAELPVHVGGSSRAAARRAGRRGDGYFPGGMLTPDERRAQLNLARATAVEAGRDPQALEYTRWASTKLTPDRVEAFAAQA